MAYQQIKNLLKPQLKKVTPLIIITFLLGIISSGCTLLLSYLTGHAIDTIQQHDQYQFQKILVIFTFLLLVAVITNYLTQQANYKIAYQLASNLRMHVIKHLQQTPFKILDTLDQGDTISRLTNDIDNIATALYQVFNSLTLGLTTVIAALALMLTMSLPLTIVVLVLTPIIFYFTTLIATKSQNNYDKQQQIYGEMTNHIEEYIGYLPLIKLDQYSSTAYANYQKLNDELYTVGQKAQFISSLTNPLSRFVDHLTYASIGLIGGLIYFHTHQTTTIGLISSFTLYASQFAKPFIELSGLTNQMQTAYTGLKRLSSLAELPIITKQRTLPTRQTDSYLSFHNVSFGYETNRLILKNLNFNIARGEQVAIVGPTGAGKSTIINLLLNFYEPNQGQIYLEGVPLANLENNLYNKIALVTQDTWLYDGTIYDNLTLGNQNISKQKFDAACQAMNIDKIIQHLPNGYQTKISDAKLSLGERQLITIARAYLKDPEILVLDEATSSLDAITEKLIQQALKTLMQERTSIIIAHHLNTILDADQIIVLQDGTIIEQGTHQELMHANTKVYRTLYEKQFNLKGEIL